MVNYKLVSICIDNVAEYDRAESYTCSWSQNDIIIIMKTTPNYPAHLFDPIYKVAFRHGTPHAVANVGNTNARFVREEGLTKTTDCVDTHFAVLIFSTMEFVLFKLVFGCVSYVTF